MEKIRIFIAFVPAEIYQQSNKGKWWIKYFLWYYGLCIWPDIFQEKKILFQAEFSIVIETEWCWLEMFFCHAKSAQFVDFSCFLCFNQKYLKADKH